MQAAWTEPPDRTSMRTLPPRRRPHIRAPDPVDPLAEAKRVVADHLSGLSRSCAVWKLRATQPLA